MAGLPGVRNNHPDQLRRLNLASLAPTAMLHANLRTTMLPRVERPFNILNCRCRSVATDPARPGDRRAWPFHCRWCWRRQQGAT